MLGSALNTALSAIQHKRNKNKREEKRNDVWKGNGKEEWRENDMHRPKEKTTSLTIRFWQYKRDHLQEMTANYTRNELNKLNKIMRSLELCSSQ